MNFQGVSAGGLMNLAIRLQRKAFAIGLSALLLVLLVLPQLAVALTANTLGDYNDVTVMEVSGNYDAVDAYGQPDMSARRTLAREFYRTHGDDYDFLVIFTNFNFVMPANAKAFFSPAKNDVQGIGLLLSDDTNSYSYDGSYLNRLEGTIDMANISSHVLEPTDPEFDDTLLALSHEMAHRWSAYIQFDENGTDSNALLGLADAHWSFLLDSEGSTLYGNNWQDNGDGTFTTIQPEQGRDNEPIGRIFSPLDLYLMGLIDKSQVPTMTLIDSPDATRDQIPEIGVTITGTAKTVTIGDIIAVEGERVPLVADARDEFRTAYIYAVAPGTWSDSDSKNLGELAAINHLQSEWVKRFSILTDGAGKVETSFVVEEIVDTNPGVTDPLTTAHVAPHVNEGVNWLMDNQQLDGSWQDRQGTAQRDTATAVVALKKFPVGAVSVVSGQSWLGGVTSENSDFFARKLLGLNNANLTEIEALQNVDGGWGSASGYCSNPVDTALALKALTAHGSTNTSVIDAAIIYLHSTQNPDGGWNTGLGSSMVQATAYALLALNDYRDNPSYILEPTITDGAVWLAAKQNSDGGFGNSPSTVYDSATALSALQVIGASQSNTEAITYLLNTQDDSGSWNDSAFQTALAVQALYAGTMQTDLQVEAFDLSITPFPVVSIPADITFSAQIWNHGDAAVSPVRVVLYQGSPALGVTAGEVEISIAGHSFTNVDFPVHLATSGDVEYFILVDPDDQVAEVNNNNNLASMAFDAGVQPTVGFDLVSASGLESVTGVVEISLSHAWDQVVSIDLDIDSASTATTGADYNVTPGPLAFNPGQTLQTVAVNIVNDVIPEGDETLLLSLSNPVNATLSQDRTTYTILNDDVPPVVGFAVTNGSGPEDVGAVSIAVELSRAYPLDVTVDYVIDNAASVATPDDVVIAAGTLVILAGETLAVIDMTIVNDTLEEPDEVLVIRLANSQEALLGIDTFTYTILNSDAAPQVTITSPVNNESYSSGQVTLLYQTNMPAGQVTVYLNDVAVETRDGQSILQGNGTYTVRVVASNVNNLSIEDVVTFEIDDSGQPPVFVWQNLLQGGLAGGKTYRCLQYSADGAMYAVKNLESEPPTVEKFDQNGYVHWSKTVPEDSYSYNYCKDSAMTEDAYVILDATSIRWFSDASNASGVLSHNVELPVYADSSWSMFAMDTEDNYFLVGPTNEGITNKAKANGGNIQLVKMDIANNVLWRQVIATNLTDIITDVTTDSSGNVYLLGTTGGYLGESGGSSAGETDVFLIKLGSDGNQLWSRQWGTSLAENSSQLAVDSQGNVVLLGDTFGTFDDSGPTFDQDAFVIKVAPDGTELWLSQDHGVSSGQVLTLSKEDDVLIAGWFGRKRSGYNVDLSAKWSRYAADGGHIWTSSISTGSLSYNDSVLGLVADPSGNLFVSASYLYENYTTMKWESRGFIAKYKIGMDLSPPLLTVNPYLYDPANKLLALSGMHEYMADLSVQVDTPATVSTSTSKYSTGWTSVISDLSPEQHRIIIEVTDNDGVVSQKEIALDVIAPSPFVTGVTNQYGTSNHDVPLASAISDQDQLYVVGYEETPDGSYQDVTIWQANINGTMLPFAKIDMAAQERGKAVTVDANGFVYMAWVSGGNSYVGKFDAIGNQIWTSDYSSRKGLQNVEGMTVDAFGNVFIAGQTDVSPDRNVTHGGSQDYFLVKFNSNGAYQWSRLSGPGHPGDQGAYGLDVDSTGHVYLAGFSQGTIHGESSANSAFVARFDNDGNLQWVDVIEASRPGAIKDLVVDQFDNAYVLGEVDYLTGRGKDVFLAKYAPSGTMSWFETFSGDFNDYAKDISLDKNDNILMTCLMNRSPYLNVFKSDILWAKYDSSAHLMWVERFDADTSGDATGIHETSRGNILVTGRTNLTLGEINHGLSDMFAREFKLVSGPTLIVDPVMTPTASQTVHLSGQVSQDAAVSIAVSAPASSTATVGAVSLNSLTGFWSCQVMNLVPDRDNVLTVLASDSYGTSLQSLTITVDTIPPNLFIDDVSSTTVLPTLRLSGSVEAGATLTVEVNPPGAQTGIAETNGLWSYTADLVEGDNEIIFTATDVVGNVAWDMVAITRLSPPPPSISVHPETFQQGDPSDVTLTINNPNGVGASVYVVMLYDVTGDGFSVDDISVRKFHLYDGVFSDDPNVPGDEDGVVDGRLTATLNFQYIYDVQRAPGSYIFKASLDSNEYVAPFSIIETSQAQTVQGYVSDGLNNPITSARVQMFDKWSHRYGYAYTDVAGHYVFNVAKPGKYFLIPTSSDYAYDKSNIMVENLAAGQNLNVDLSMVLGSTSISGWLKDSGTSEIITSGNYVRAENDQYVAEAYDLAQITATDDDFKYKISVPEGDYDLYLDSFNSRGTFAQGYLGFEGIAAQTFQVPPELWLDKAAGLVCGKVIDQSMMGVAGVVIVARSNSETAQFSTAVSAAGGDYCIGLSDNDSWRISLNDKANQAIGYVGNYVDGITGGTGPFNGNDLSVNAIDAWVSGTVLENGQDPVAGVSVELSNAATGFIVRGETAFDGSYRLGAFAGGWSVKISPESLGHPSVNPVAVSLAIGQTTTQDFNVSPQSEPPFVDVLVQTPTDQSSQTIGGNRSENATVTVAVDTDASVGAVVPLTPTTWQCTIANLKEGTNMVSVAASNGVDSYQAPDVSIDYHPAQQVNTIAITRALYTSRKNTLVVDATSDYPEATLVVEYAGTTVPMTFARLFKGKSFWSHTDSNVTAAPVVVTVSGAEGSVTTTVTVK